MAVDDNFFNLFVLKETLKNEYKIKTCLSGEEAISNLKK